MSAQPAVASSDIDLTIPLDATTSSASPQRNTNDGPFSSSSLTSRHASVRTTTATTTATTTITETTETEDTNEVLSLTLAARPTVRWDESTVDNEGLGRKSSKRCCIFHKQRDFGDSSTDSSDAESDNGSSSSSSGGGGGQKKITKKKKGKKKVPDYQRFHA